MEIHISHIAFGTDIYKLKERLASILHAPPFRGPSGPLFNFDVRLIPQRKQGAWWSAALTLPNRQIGERLLDLYGPPSPRHSLEVGSTWVQFQRSRGEVRRDVLERVRRLPYEDPQVAKCREEVATELRELGEVKVALVQFGWECRDRTFSSEWETSPHMGTLFLDSERREFRLKAINRASDAVRHHAVIRLSQIAWLSVSPSSTSHQSLERHCIHFSLHYPPIFESETLLNYDNGFGPPPQRRREPAFQPSHVPLAPYTTISLRLQCGTTADIYTFRQLLRHTSISPIDSPSPVEHRGVFSETWRDRYDAWIRTIPWSVAFHIEGLVRAWLVSLEEVLSLRYDIDRLLRKNGRGYTASLFRDFAAQMKQLWWYGEESPQSGDTSLRHPQAPSEGLNIVRDLFTQIRDRFVYDPTIPAGADPTDSATAPFNCMRVIVTPTTIHLRGPFPEQSNRVMRTYYKNQDCFLRVSFQDENSLQYRFDRDVDGQSLISRRVKQVLLDGIAIAGAHFEFLAYSQSALKEHAVWFVKPFRHRNSHGNIEIVNAATIIASLGNFRALPFDPRLMYCPARYAARISQAFTSTDASVPISVGQIIHGRDIKTRNGKHTFTDGVGTISPRLAKEMWTILQTQRGRGGTGRAYPRAWQIRFQGSKGVLSVDYTLSSARAILIRPSMIKFSAPQSLTIEIARAFDKPGKFYLNRPLIMVLECLGVPYEVFKDLQATAVREARHATRSLQASARLLEGHGLGMSFRLTSTMLGLYKLGLQPLKDNIFWRQMMSFATNHVLRELKHRARIPVPGLNSWSLVGVADVHGCLEEREVFVCVDAPDGKRYYLEGEVLVTRSPCVHPGDVQVATAIGRPPPGSPLFKEPLPNTIVFSVRGVGFCLCL